MFRIILTSALVLSLSCFSWTQSSRSGNYYAEVEIEAKAKRWPEGNSWKATVYDQVGTMQYQISKEVPFDVQYPAIQISDVGGRSVVYSPFEGWIEFYNGKGNVVSTVLPFVGEKPEYERILKCSIAGERAAFLISEPSAPHARVLLTDLEGNQFWDVSLDLKIAAEILLSANSEYVLAGSYTSDDRIERSTTLLDKDGKMQKMFHGIFRYADFDEEENRVVFTERNAVVIASIYDGEPSVRWSSNSREEVVTGARFAGCYVGVVVEKVSLETGKPLYNNPLLVVLNEKAEVLLRKQLVQVSEHPATLRTDGEILTLSSGGSQVRVDVREIE